jgi:hypothetical protein
MGTMIDNMTPKEWEKFCEKMLRQHFGSRNFWPVPDEDGGDLGLEFFTSDGTIFQCYYPDKDADMKTYKKKVQDKINTDLGKLEKNKSEIQIMLDNIVIDQWILLIPKLKSKDLLKYCNKKKKEVILKNISYINNAKFQVKIETADSYPNGKLFAQSVCSKPVAIPFELVSDREKEIWKESNSEFFSNINRKSKKLMPSRSEKFQNVVLGKYIQIEKFLDQLREEYPDLLENIEDTARAQRESMQEESCFSDCNDLFVEKVLDRNKSAFSKHSIYMSDENLQSLSFGYLSKWVAECFMDFK